MLQIFDTTTVRMLAKHAIHAYHKPTGLLSDNKCCQRLQLSRVDTLCYVVFQVKGISSIGGHTAERTACVNEFVRLFGRMPLMQKDLSMHSGAWRLRLSTLLDRAI